VPAWELDTGGFGKPPGHKLGPPRSSLFRRHSARSVRGRRSATGEQGSHVSRLVRQ